MKEVSRLLPQENLIYLGDTAHLPYGNKSPETVLQFALDNAAFLVEKNIKLLLIPCHTACSHALATLQDRLSIPVIGVIEPGLELVKYIERIAILATTSTIESGIYQTQIQMKNPKAKIYAQACPLFVPLIEEGFHESPAAEFVAESYLAPLRGKVDAALLACTHYPLIRPIIQKVLGPQVNLIEPATNCAQLALDYLTNSGLLNRQTGKPTIEFYATDDPEKFRRFGKVFLGSCIENIEKK